MRTLRSGLLAIVVPAALALPALASQVPPAFQAGHYGAAGATGSLSFVVHRGQITRLQVRMPLSCRNTRTHRVTAPVLAFGAGGSSTTYARMYLPADGSANVTFVADDNARRPEIYLSLQLHGRAGHVSVHARSQAARETCSGELGLDVHAR
jgi:hypothetical protein